MRALAEARWIKEGTEGEETPTYEKGRFWILHYGLKYDLIHIGEGKMVAVNYTVVICQDCKTGQLREFMAPQLKIIGDEIKK